MRGKHQECYGELVVSRITPAGAGKTGFPQCAWVSDSGSPPQVRGKQIYDRLITMEDRITPAGAGKTRSRCRQKYRGQDHPRRCGENVSLVPFCMRYLGSPPQVRGKPAAALWVHELSGITPAGAGKTEYYAFPDEETGDHPRRCGENLQAITTPTAWTGSPPQVRGKRRSRINPYPNDRITPAGAGKTETGIPLPGGNRDHPRRCGENNE